MNFPLTFEVNSESRIALVCDKPALITLLFSYIPCCYLVIVLCNSEWHAQTYRPILDLHLKAPQKDLLSSIPTIIVDRGLH